MRSMKLGVATLIFGSYSRDDGKPFEIQFKDLIEAPNVETLLHKTVETGEDVDYVSSVSVEHSVMYLPVRVCLSVQQHLELRDRQHMLQQEHLIMKIY